MQLRPESVVATLVLAVCVGVFAVLTGIYEFSVAKAGVAAAGVAILGVVEFVLDESSI